MAATTSTSCSSFWSGLRPGGARARKLDGVATWLIHGVTSAFFASLERCSCVRVTTVEDSEDLNEMPLIFNDANTSRDGSMRDARRRGGRSGKKGGGYDVDQDYQ